MPSNSEALFGIRRYSVLVETPARRGHGLHAGRRIAAIGERVPRGLVNDLARFVVGADLRAAAGSAGPGGVDLSHAFT